MIETMDDLYEKKQSVANDQDNLVVKREKLRNKIRRAQPDVKIELCKAKSDLSKELNILGSIEEMSENIDEKLNMLYENEHQAKQSSIKQKGYSR